ncbi:ParB/RepB/Spo0J family partition protein [Mesorhizobium sp. AR07]|uniref:ParB/RepB/Spo0J family partition protein n=1 Tax=Mesorhizobium sp. AR07 TaxID=2865838 RepID=UPI00215E2A3D|nr:ParB/RepB/Spo0J family partition protein [Mesorhizobium sp. AR07]UVK45335.1 ParB/RepB/Spo0J family partition protein [Mesorhizobium sp. AR07]
MADLSKPAVISDIDIALVDVADGRRRLDPAWVKTLSDLFASQGQLSPIEVVDADGRFKLVFGGHRLEAAKLVGWTKIAAVVKDTAAFAGAAEIMLREITENIARRDLSALDRSVDVARWRELFEAAKGTVRRGRPSKLSQVATISDDVVDRFAASFSETARKVLGMNRDAISRAMRIASIPASVRDEISLRPIADNQSDLLLLAAIDDIGRQAAIGVVIGSQQATTFAEAIAILDRAPKPRPEPKWQKLAQDFSKMKDGEQDRFFELHEAAIRRWLKGRAS